MIPNRIPDETACLAPSMPAGFLMIPVPAAPYQPQSPLHGLYQQMYDEATAVARKPSMRDLFAVMN